MSFSFRILFLLIFYCGPLLSHANAKETISILLFGDSIVAGYGLSEEEALPARLQTLLQESHKGIKVINGGVSGDTTSGGRSRLAWTLDKHHPDLVILALGGNDVLRGIQPKITKDNLNAMLELLKQRNIPAILTAVEAPANLGAAYSKEFGAVFKEAAKSYSVPLYPFLITDTFGKNDLMQPDGIHPNAKGANLIAAGLAKYLKKSPQLAKPY